MALYIRVEKVRSNTRKPERAERGKTCVLLEAQYAATNGQVPRYGTPPAQGTPKVATPNRFLCYMKGSASGDED